MARILLFLVLAWPLAAFGGVYRWATVPYLAGCGVLALTQAGGIRDARSGDRWLDLSLVSLVAGAWLQLLPLPESVLARISPETLPVMDALQLVALETTLAGVSVEPRSTVWASGILTANVVLFLAVQALFLRGGVRWSIRIIAWLGIVFATLGLAQAASGSGAVYWWWEPLGEGAEPFGTFINRNHFATWVIMAAPACFGYAVARLHLSASDNPTRHWAARLVSVFDGRALFLLFAGILMTSALLTNLSRSGMLGLATAAVYVLIASSRKIDQRRRRWLGAYIAAAAIIVVAFADAGALIQRVEQTIAPGSGRIAIWRDTLPLIGDFWATGTGCGDLPDGYAGIQDIGPVVLFQPGAQPVSADRRRGRSAPVGAGGGRAAVLCAAGVPPRHERPHRRVLDPTRRVGRDRCGDGAESLGDRAADAGQRGAGRSTGRRRGPRATPSFAPG